MMPFELERLRQLQTVRLRRAPTLTEADERFRAARFARNCYVRLQHTLRR
jgi:hypothetical protein